MRVLMTGATGYVGRRALEAVLRDGHDVTAIVRAEGDASVLPELVRRETGDFAAPEAIVAKASEADAVLHLGFPAHGSDWAAAVEVEAQFLRQLAEALSGRTTKVVVANGTIFLGPSGDEPLDHASPVVADHPAAIRAAATARISADDRLCGIELRFASFIYGHGGSVFLPVLRRHALDRGEVPFVGDGSARISTVHVADAGRACALALRQERAEGVYTIASDESPTVRQLAEALAHGTGARAVSVTMEEAAERLDPFTAMFLATPNQVSALRARTELGWYPQAAETLIWEAAFGSYAGRS